MGNQLNMFGVWVGGWVLSVTSVHRGTANTTAEQHKDQRRAKHCCWGGGRRTRGGSKYNVGNQRFFCRVVCQGESKWGTS